MYNIIVIEDKYPNGDNKVLIKGIDVLEYPACEENFGTVYWRFKNYLWTKQRYIRALREYSNKDAHLNDVKGDLNKYSNVEYHYNRLEVTIKELKALYKNKLVEINTLYNKLIC